ncbi:hypothetical protein DIPPA_13593 [Diplonema papillatum]|nr:hypothetical protein DIPPA_13593 [Diplonema papillatum]
MGGDEGGSHSSSSRCNSESTDDVEWSNGVFDWRRAVREKVQEMQAQRTIKAKQAHSARWPAHRAGIEPYRYWCDWKPPHAKEGLDARAPGMAVDGRAGKRADRRGRLMRVYLNGALCVLRRNRGKGTEAVTGEDGAEMVVECFTVLPDESRPRSAAKTRAAPPPGGTPAQPLQACPPRSARKGHPGHSGHSGHVVHSEHSEPGRWSAGLAVPPDNLCAAVADAGRALPPTNCLAVRELSGDAPGDGPFFENNVPAAAAAEPLQACPPRSARKGHIRHPRHPEHSGHPRHSGPSGLSRHSGHSGLSMHSGHPRHSGPSGLSRHSGHSGLSMHSGHPGNPGHSGHSGPNPRSARLAVPRAAAADAGHALPPPSRSDARVPPPNCWGVGGGTRAPPGDGPSSENHVRGAAAAAERPLEAPATAREYAVARRTSAGAAPQMGGPDAGHRHQLARVARGVSSGGGGRDWHVSPAAAAVPGSPPECADAFSEAGDASEADSGAECIPRGWDNSCGPQAGRQGEPPGGWFRGSVGAARDDGVGAVYAFCGTPVQATGTCPRCRTLRRGGSGTPETDGEGIPPSWNGSRSPQARQQMEPGGVWVRGSVGTARENVSSRRSRHPAAPVAGAVCTFCCGTPLQATGACPHCRALRRGDTSETVSGTECIPPSWNDSLGPQAGRQPEPPGGWVRGSGGAARDNAPSAGPGVSAVCAFCCGTPLQATGACPHCRALRRGGSGRPAKAGGSRRWRSGHSSASLNGRCHRHADPAGTAGCGGPEPPPPPSGRGHPGGRRAPQPGGSRGLLAGTTPPVGSDCSPVLQECRCCWQCARNEHPAGSSAPPGQPVHPPMHAWPATEPASHAGQPVPANQSFAPARSQRQNPRLVAGRWQPQPNPGRWRGRGAGEGPPHCDAGVLALCNGTPPQLADCATSGLRARNPVVIGGSIGAQDPAAPSTSAAPGDTETGESRCRTDLRLDALGRMEANRDALPTDQHDPCSSAANGAMLDAEGRVAPLPDASQSDLAPLVATGCGSPGRQVFRAPTGAAQGQFDGAGKFMLSGGSAAGAHGAPGTGPPPQSASAHRARLPLPKSRCAAVGSSAGVPHTSVPSLSSAAAPASGLASSAAAALVVKEEGERRADASWTAAPPSPAASLRNPMVASTLAVNMGLPENALLDAAARGGGLAGSAAAALLREEGERRADASWTAVPPSPAASLARDRMVVSTLAVEVGRRESALWDAVAPGAGLVNNEASAFLKEEAGRRADASWTAAPPSLTSLARDPMVASTLAGEAGRWESALSDAVTPGADLANSAAAAFLEGEAGRRADVSRTAAPPSPAASLARDASVLAEEAGWPVNVPSDAAAPSPHSSFLRDSNVVSALDEEAEWWTKESLDAAAPSQTASLARDPAFDTALASLVGEEAGWRTNVSLGEATVRKYLLATRRGSACCTTRRT